MTSNEKTSSRALIDEATSAFMSGRADDALTILDSIPPNAVAELAYSIDFTRGMIFEFGGRGVTPDPAAAEHCFRKVVLASGHNDSSAMRYLARVLIQQGQSRYAEAERWLDAAARACPSPLVSLGFGYLYETCEPPDFEKAKRHYWAALLRGRFAGGFGLQRILRSQGRIWSAQMVMLLHVLFGPPAALFLGRRSRETFHRS